MKLDDIVVGMKVVCKESHSGNEEHFWATPEMDVAVGKPMTVEYVGEELVCCVLDTPIEYDDGLWWFLPKWLEPWKKEDEDVGEKN